MVFDPTLFPVTSGGNSAIYKVLATVQANFAQGSKRFTETIQYLFDYDMIVDYNDIMSSYEIKSYSRYERTKAKFNMVDPSKNKQPQVQQQVQGQQQQVEEGVDSSVSSIYQISPIFFISIFISVISLLSSQFF